MRKDIERRLINLSLEINKLCKHLDDSYLSKHLTWQVIRSSTSAALNYGEVQGAESRNDFIHKNGVVLKELRETKISLLLIDGTISSNDLEVLSFCLDECDQLVAIFHRTVMTLKQGR